MPDEPDKKEAAPLPPKLNLRKQGVLKPKTDAETSAEKESGTTKQEAPGTPDATQNKIEMKPVGEPEPKRGTSRLVVKPASTTAAAGANAKPDAEPADTKPDTASKPSPALAAAEKAAEEATPALTVKPRSPKPAVKPAVATANAEDESSESKMDAAANAGDTKRKTSRIPLASAQAPKEAEQEKVPLAKPKTIKIKPATPPPRIMSTQPLNVTLPIPDEDADRTGDAEKHKTSRIPLEDALTADKESGNKEAPGEAAAPKTIKIKRPGGSASTVKVNEAGTSAGSADMSKTARLDQLPLDEPGTSPTQKRTIRVKRPDAVADTTTPAPSETGAGITAPQPIDSAPSDEPGALWALLALAASLVLCVVIYMFAAQAFGPNISGTALSSWTTGPNLSWPGKIMN